MKISKSMIFRICMLAVFLVSAQLGFATNNTPVPIPPDKSSLPPIGGGSRPSLIDETTPLEVDSAASATISDVELAVYFDHSVGDATITVYDSSDNVVYEEVVNTESVFDAYVSVFGWAADEYMITVTYGVTTQRGFFVVE
ncbi:MAG: hypothetical protein ACOYOT_04570 [Bacteroidales bacterium]